MNAQNYGFIRWVLSLCGSKNSGNARLKTDNYRQLSVGSKMFNIN